MSDRYEPFYPGDEEDGDEYANKAYSSPEPYSPDPYSAHDLGAYQDPYEVYDSAPYDQPSEPAPLFVDENTRYEESGAPLLGADALPTEEEENKPSLYRGGTGDPTFGLLLATAVAIGLTPMLPANADLRYTLAWGVLAAIGVLAWLLGNGARIGQEKPENLIAGVGFALLVGTPFTLFGWDVLGRAGGLMFPGMPIGTLLAYLIFVMPIAETLFFRGVFQRSLDFWLIGLIAGIWEIVLFFPVMWGELLQSPAVGIVLAIGIFAMTMLYSYVRERNGLAAAWVCQIILNILMVFLPALGQA
ncbi:CPBP family intramembrane metalloprotease [Phototrophicus methaneseepsis]|uniref:CPBP family intramembrane metalloprotease n=1 Tax=Phototrophicus methaneseepsis TaxID=2710758 RepID=A0A7S8EDQ5_9CHLR|nr:type II CAAX endopeptidase family protein [Phototrophicus methaneseepsis]QPC85087.1 CPBP family intramembrane metalloprotease [Phototrophicus methaneseepsis]